MRNKRMKREHQGKLTIKDRIFAATMESHSGTYYTSLDICNMTGCVSARDKVRKLQANGVKIGPANLLHISESGARIYGWRIEK